MARLPRIVAVLKTPGFGAAARANRGRLPYRIDVLRERGYELAWTDAHLRRPWTSRPVRSVVARLERAGTPIVQTVLAAPAIVRADTTMAMFESEGHFLALLRSLLPGRRKRKLVIIACWLAEIVPGLSPRKLALYRRLYRAVDRVVVYSSNQPAILERWLAVPRDRIAVVPFGVDTDELAGLDTSEDGTILAVGRDAGRDWSTFFGAVRDTGWKVSVACRPRLLDGLDVPPEVEVLGYVDRDRYKALLAGCSVVVVPTKELAYPTGQSVLLEAMALGKACVVTATPAMADYAQDERTCLTTPLGDAAALRAAIGRLLDDPALRHRLGAAAAADVAARWHHRVMWHAIADVIDAADSAPSR